MTAGKLMTGLAGNFGQTPSQTVGPFFAYALVPAQYGYPFGQPFGATLAAPDAPGTPVVLEGALFDGDGQPVTDALVEIAQADAAGRIGPSAHFQGFGRCGTGTLPGGLFRFHTVKPGPEAPGLAPQIQLAVFMRGLLLHLATRCWFDDEAAANAADPGWRALPPERRHTLLARRLPAAGVATYRFDIRLQGPDETAFLMP